MEKPVIYDLFCKAGGAGMGYARAGFEIIGIDIEPQPNYPFKFYRGDVRKIVNWGKAVAVHASPVCKVHTSLKAFSWTHHENQIPWTRELLESSGLPYVIENVPGAPLDSPVTLCGSMFGLGVRRHRLFELGKWSMDQPACDHAKQNRESPGYPVKRYHSGKPEIVISPVIGVYGRGQGLGSGEVGLWRQAMGIDWMTRDEMSQAIPPAYTELIGKQLLEYLDIRT